MKKFVLNALLAALAFGDNTFNVQITNDTLAVYAQGAITNNNIYARGYFLYNDEKGKYNFYSVGLKGEGHLIGSEYTNTKFSLLLDFVHTKDNSALPLGFGFFSYIPGLQYPVFLRGEYEFAPKVLSFNDANRFSKVDMQFGVQPIENGEIFVGYRNISFNRNYESAIYGGLGYHF